MAKSKAEETALTILSEPPADIAELLKEDYGKGVSTKQSDNLVPLIYVLQPLSPQVQRRNEAYIEGAEPGCFWLRNAPTEIFSGEDGLLVQPCFFNKDWVEWRPRTSGGGFVGRHAEIVDDQCPVADAEQREDNRFKWTRPNGNELVHTRSHVFRVFTPGGIWPYIFPFTSTGHATSKALTNLITTKTNSVGFAGKYRLTTRERSNQMGTWFGVDVKFDSFCNKEEYLEGKKLYEAFASGAKVAATPDDTVLNKDEIPF